jgi:uncharacterized membrane protein YdjX (TVP38/TMEM64 family)
MRGVQLRRVALISGVLMLVGAAAAPAWTLPAIGNLEEIVRWLRGLGGAGWVGFIAIQILVSMSGVLPASALSIAAGIIYGVPLGFGLAASSTGFGAILAFALSRSFLRLFIARIISRRPRLELLDQALTIEGWRLVCLLRVSPVMPFAVTSYALGLSSIKLRDYLIGTLAALPALLGYVAIGSLAGASAVAWNSGAGAIRLSLLVIGAVATVIATLWFGVLVTRVIRRA